MILLQFLRVVLIFLFNSLKQVDASGLGPWSEWIYDLKVLNRHCILQWCRVLCYVVLQRVSWNCWRLSKCIVENEWKFYGENKLCKMTKGADKGWWVSMQYKQNKNKNGRAWKLKWLQVEGGWWCGDTDTELYVHLP